jgi:hypothetical protein
VCVCVCFHVMHVCVCVCFHVMHACVCVCVCVCASVFLGVLVVV